MDVYVSSKQKRFTPVMLRAFWSTPATLRLAVFCFMLLLIRHIHRQFTTDQDEAKPLETYEQPKPVSEPGPVKYIVSIVNNCTGEYDDYRRAHPYGTDPEDSDPTIHITSLTEIQPDRWQWMAEGSWFFTKRCPNLRPWMKCRYHQNATGGVIRQSHALLFHARHMLYSEGRRSFKTMPTYRHPDQKWIFYEPETPTNTWNYADLDAPYWKMFNLTATFTMDSDIPVQYHQRTYKRIPNWKPTNINYASNRSVAAWFVSHCTCSSKRELYVNEMMKTMKVDVYGECGDSKTCSRTGHNPKGCMMDLLNNNYKFYLSFENAFCTNYVTEKFHSIVTMIDVVPVVMGAADYVNILPAGSYIDIRDFQSPRELAKYLLMLDKNDDLYNQYIEAKKAYVADRLPPFSCSLCEYLHHHRYEQQEVFDAASFWSVEQRCTDPRVFYKGFADSIVPKIKYNIDPYLFL